MNHQSTNDTIVELTEALIDLQYTATTKTNDDYAKLVYAVITLDKIKDRLRGILNAERIQRTAEEQLEVCQLLQEVEWFKDKRKLAQPRYQPCSPSPKHIIADWRIK